MQNIFQYPPVLSGSPETRIAQLQAYLFKASEAITIALNNISFDNFTKETKEEIKGSAQKAETDLGNQYNQLKALIIKTADIIRLEMDVLQTKLEYEYNAISAEWGDYQENITNEITATAQGVVQSFGYDAQIKSLQDQATDFSDYKVHTEGYIRQGFITYDDSGVPIIGIAIGQGLTTTGLTEIVNGVEVEQLNNDQNCAFYTAEKVSFRIGGKEVAYVSNQKLYIGDAEVNGRFSFGGKWLITHTNGFTLKWIGD